VIEKSLDHHVCNYRATEGSPGFTGFLRFHAMQNAALRSALETELLRFQHLWKILLPHMK
jgi:hypothetical protein